MSNSFSNRVSATLAAAAIANIKTAIATIKTNMPFLVGITTQERQTIPKINEANRVFTADALNAVANNANMLPAYFNAAELKLDYDLYTALDEINLLITQLAELINDTQTLAGSEAYISALSAYRLFGAAAAGGVPGADAVYEALAQRFKNQGPSGETPAPTPDTPVNPA
ncbi:hypothetical protein EMGBS15_09220 [Filimonas sp.]|jgi:hypothetical protein|nr:hypothetical protein EMGBS15_09220 [Filimonas sp.]